MEVFICILIAFFGLSVGSFLNVVILRYDTLSTIWRGRSHCPNCKKVLSWYELVPFFSYILLFGKCRACKKKISIQYPLVELLTGLIFVLIYFYFGITLEAVILATISSTLIVIATYDILHMEIPDALSFLGIILVLALALYRMLLARGQVDFDVLRFYGYGILVAAGFLALLVILSSQRWMGAGDIAIGAIMGALLGFPNVLFALFMAFLIGSVFGIIMMAFRKKHLGDPVPFGPFLVLGTMIALFWGGQFLATYWNFYW